VGFFTAMGAYIAGSMQHLKTFIYIFMLVVVVLYFLVAVLIGFLLKKGGNTKTIKTIKKRRWRIRGKGMPSASTSCC
jgi:hypothetical protein